MNDAALPDEEIGEPDEPLVIDGSSGEGGGQILRSSLALSLVTGKPFRIERIRSKRSRPGLLRQHLTAVRAATEIGLATVTGDSLGSTELSFAPTTIEPGDYHFSIGTAGSTTLVLQTILPPLLRAGKPSRVVIEGGTHNASAPPFEFISKSFLPVLRQMGVTIEATLVRPGFYPAGGGRIEVTLEPLEELRPIRLVDRGEIVNKRVRAVISQLSPNIGHREVDLLKRQFSLPRSAVGVEVVESTGPGNVAFIELECEHVTEVFTGFGMVGKPAESVAREALRGARRYLKSSAPVGEYLTDQLLIPFAMAGSGEYMATTVSPHTETNIDVIQRFLDVEIEVDRAGQHGNRFTFRRSNSEETS